MSRSIVIAPHLPSCTFFINASIFFFNDGWTYRSAMGKKGLSSSGREVHVASHPEREVHGASAAGADVYVSDFLHRVTRRAIVDANVARTTTRRRTSNQIIDAVLDFFLLEKME